MQAPRVPILVALADPASDWDREGAATGFVFFLVKPVLPENLLAVLRECEMALA